MKLWRLPGSDRHHLSPGCLYVLASQGTPTVVDVDPGDVLVCHTCENRHGAVEQPS